MRNLELPVPFFQKALTDSLFTGIIEKQFADVAELADALDLGSSGHPRAGSSPVIRTKRKSACEPKRFAGVFLFLIYDLSLFFVKCFLFLFWCPALIFCTFQGCLKSAVLGQFSLLRLKNGVLCRKFVVKISTIFSKFEQQLRLFILGYICLLDCFLQFIDLIMHIKFRCHFNIFMSHNFLN